MHCGISHIQLAVGCAYCRSAPGLRLGIGNRGGLKCDGRGGASMESASVPYLDRRKNSVGLGLGGMVNVIQDTNG